MWVTSRNLRARSAVGVSSGALLACWFIGSWASPTEAGGRVPSTEGEANPPKSVAEFCLTGFLAGREQLQTAELEIEQTSTAMGQALPPWTYFIAIDMPTGRLRFDSKSSGRDVRTIHLRDREILYLARENGPVTVYPPGGAPTIQGSRAIDLRAIGIASMAEFQNRTSFDDIVQHLRQAEVSNVKDEHGSEYVVTWTYPLRPAGSALTAVCFDKEKGFSAVRMEDSSVFPGGNIQPLIPNERVETTWERHLDVWIPSLCEFQRQKPSAQVKLVFKWKQVNQPPANDLFDIRTIVPPGTTVVDNRLGKAEMVPVERFERGGTETDQSPADLEKTAFLRRALFTVNLIGVVALGVYCVFRVRTRNRSLRVSERSTESTLT
jgi:hypothetical protein